MTDPLGSRTPLAAGTGPAPRIYFWVDVLRLALACGDTRGGAWPR